MTNMTKKNYQLKQFKIFKHSFLIYLLILITQLFIATPTYADSDPVAMLQNVADSMIAGLKANKATLKTKPQVVYNLAYQYVVPNADLDEMSKRVLPPQAWNNATSAQREQFKKEFTQTLIRTYASALTSYSDQQIRFFPVRGGYQGLNSIVVNSEITSSESQPIQVSYRLLHVGGSWKLYDMSVEGVSMLNSFRSQFASILSSGNMDQLLQRMSRHNNR